MEIDGVGESVTGSMEVGVSEERIEEDLAGGLRRIQRGTTVGLACMYDRYKPNEKVDGSEGGDDQDVNEDNHERTEEQSDAATKDQQKSRAPSFRR